MPATIIDSAIFGNLFSTEAMRQVWSDETARASISTSRRLWRASRPGSHHPREGGAEIVRNCRLEKIDLQKLRAQTGAHRLPGAGRGPAARGAVRGRPRRMVPLGRHHPGHHRHRHGAANPRGPRAHRGRPHCDLGCDGGARAPPSRYADDRAQQPAAGRSRDLRLQDGRASLRDRAASRASRGAASARADG